MWYGNSIDLINFNQNCLMDGVEIERGRERW